MVTPMGTSRFITAVLILAGAAPASESFRPLPMRTATAALAGQAGGEGGQVISMTWYAPDGRRAFAVTNVGGLWRSEDAGSTWVPSNTGLKSRGGSGGSVDPRDRDLVLLVGSDSARRAWSGLWRSVDGGRTWTLAQGTGSNGGDGPGGEGWRTIAWDPDPGTAPTRRIWWSSPTDGPEHLRGLWRSEDGGATWNRDRADLHGAWAVRTPDRALWLGRADGLWRIPGGATGAAAVRVATVPVRGLDWSPADPGRLAVLERQTLRVIDLGTGNSATRAAAGLPRSPDQPGWYALSISPVDARRMLVGHDTGVWYQQDIWRSADGGATWTKATVDATGLFIPHNRRRMAASWHPTSASTSLTGFDWMARSTDGGATWRYANDGYTGLAVVSPWRMDPRQPDLLVLTAQDYNGGISTDNGRTWRYIDPRQNGWGGHLYGGVALSPSVIAVGSATGWNGTRELRVTRDGGATWQATGLTWEAGADGGATDHGLVDPVDPRTAYLGPFRTRDGGATWEGMAGCDAAVLGDPASGRVFGIRGLLIVHSADRGGSWSVTATAPGSAMIRDLALDHVRRRLFVTQGERELRRLDLGTGTWTSLNARLPADNNGERRANTVAVDPVDPSLVYAGSRGNWYRTDRGILRSRDGGDTWTTVTISATAARAGLLDGGNEVNWLRVHPRDRTVLIATSCYGQWVLTVNDPPSLRDPTATPSRLALPP
jgi:hypothetical protein